MNFVNYKRHGYRHSWMLLLDLNKRIQCTNPLYRSLKCFLIFFATNTTFTSYGGHLYLKLDIILVKNHIIRVVFQDQAMYARTSLRGAKTQNWEKGCVFSHVNKFWKGHDGQLKEKRLFWVYFHAWKIRV